jgi:N-acetylglutamate synthase-like GNAT family acetyltransferase
MPAFAIYPGHEFFEGYLDLRYRILREPLGLPKGSEQDDSDHEPTSRHLVWMEDGEAVGCLQLQASPEPGIARLRYMAVDPSVEGQGIGRQLIELFFELAREEDYHLITLHARENAVPFYKACGFKKFEELAPFHGIRHWRMTAPTY